MPFQVFLTKDVDGIAGECMAETRLVHDVELGGFTLLLAVREWLGRDNFDARVTLQLCLRGLIKLAR